MKMWISVILMLILTTASFAGDKEQSVTADQAMYYAIKYSASQTRAGKDAALRQFGMLLSEHPDDIALRRLYSDLLIVDSRYETAISQLRVIYHNTRSPSLKLAECMLTERIQLPYAACYRDVIALFDATDLHDFDYLLALYLGEIPDYESRKQHWLKTHSLTEIQQQSLELQPQDLVRAYYP